MAKSPFTEENPYRSPPAIDDAANTAEVASDRPPPSWREIVFFGGMVGAVYHSAAGFGCGILYGAEQVVLVQGLNVRAVAVVCAMLSVAGATVGVVSGWFIGTIVAMFDQWTIRSVWRRRAVWWIARAMHLAAGGWIGYSLVAYGWWSELLSDGLISTPGYRLCMGVHLVAGLLAGWAVASRIERRFLDRIRVIGRS